MQMQYMFGTKKRTDHHNKKKGRTQCECSHVMWGLGKGHGCYLAVLPLQCKEAGSNPGCQATSGKLYHCARHALRTDHHNPVANSIQLHEIGFK